MLVSKATNQSRIIRKCCGSSISYVFQKENKDKSLKNKQNSQSFSLAFAIFHLKDTVKHNHISEYYLDKRLK